jgi:ribosome assembly protein YihI (activator of Der GTPase)
MIDMNKPFGMTAITRQDLEDMPCPIMASELTDEQMQELANIVEMEVRDRYPEVADKMFELWKKEEELTDEEQDFLDFECDRVEELWWDLVEKVAVGEIGMKYYEDMD